MRWNGSMLPRVSDPNSSVGGSSCHRTGRRTARSSWQDRRPLAPPAYRAGVAAVIEVVSGDHGSKDYGIKVLEYADAGIDAYLIADPRRGTCTLYTDPSEGKYGEPETHPFGEVVRFTADGTEFVLDTADWPRIR